MKIYHLFPALMSLYGDRGNAAVLARYAADHGGAAEVVKVESDGFGAGYASVSQVDLADADVIYMGPGTEGARNMALELLRPLSGQLKAAMARGSVMLFTGNSLTLLGQSLTTADGTAREGLGLLNFTASESGERYTGDAIGICNGKTKAVGFLNKCDRLDGVETPLFQLTMGQGNTPGSADEGIRANHLYATHLIGPLLVKNPPLLREIGQALGLNDDNGVIADGLYDQMEKAYQVTLGALEARLGQN